MSEERVRLLESIPGWRWEGDRYYDALERRVAIIKQFVRTHGRMPYPDEEFEGRSIGKWVEGIRSKFRRGVGIGHIRQLEGVPGWAW